MCTRRVSVASAYVEPYMHIDGQTSRCKGQSAVLIEALEKRVTRVDSPPEKVFRNGRGPGRAGTGSEHAAPPRLSSNCDSIAA